MDGAQIGVFKEADKVGLRCLLEGEDGGTLETEVRLEILSNLANQTLERELADEELSRLLEFADLTEGDSSRAIAMRLLDTA